MDRTAQDGAGPVWRRISLEPWVDEPPGEGRERRTGLNSRQRRAVTVMQAASEPDVGVTPGLRADPAGVEPVRVEAVRPGEFFWVPVRSRQEQADPRAPGNGRAANFDVCAGK